MQDGEELAVVGSVAGAGLWGPSLASEEAASLLIECFAGSRAFCCLLQKFDLLSIITLILHPFLLLFFLLILPQFPFPLSSLLFLMNFELLNGHFLPLLPILQIPRRLQYAQFSFEAVHEVFWHIVPSVEVRTHQTREILVPLKLESTVGFG